MRMVLTMREATERLRTKWLRQGYDLDFGAGIAAGYATLGAIGFEGRFDYAAIGRVTNLAARLCAEAPPGHILVSDRVVSAVEHVVLTESFGELSLKGFSKPIPACKILSLKKTDPR